MAVPEVVAATSSINWGDVSVVGLLVTFIAYQWKQNAKLKAEKESEMVSRIEASINNLSATIKESTEKFDSTVESMWSHIGKMDKRLSNLIGHHEVNHKMKFDKEE